MRNHKVSGVRLLPVQRIHAAKGASVVAEYFATNEPVIFEGLLEDWPARHKWSLQWFAANFTKEIKLSRFTHYASLNSTMAEFVDWLQGRRDNPLAEYEELYLAWDVNVLKQQPGLLQDLDFEGLFVKPPRYMYKALWIGGQGAHTPLHHDMNFPNLHACITGQKRFILYAQEQREFLYPSDVYEWTSEFSQIDFRRPDLHRFPKLSHATGYEAVINDGEVLYIPGLWWHAVFCDKPSITVNAWPLNLRSLLSPPMLLEYVKGALHKMGWYAKDRCTCCGHGDLRRHLGW